MLATDRDLLVLEPTLFRDLVFPGQRLLKGLGTIADTAFELTSGDSDLERADIGPGHVLTINGVACEVIERAGPYDAVVSRLRAVETDPFLPPAPTVGGEVVAATFRPQLADATLRVLRMLGLPDAPPTAAAAAEASITNPAALRRLTALLALEAVFGAAGSLLAATHPANERAAAYARRARAEAAHAVATIDTNGDALPDATRRPTPNPLTRA